MYKIPGLIAKSPYKSEFFIGLLELTPATYYRKLKNSSFSITEVKKLTETLFPKEAYKREILKRLETSRKEIKSSNYKTVEQVQEEIQKY